VGPTFSNSDAIDATTLINGSIISPSVTSLVFFVNNAAGPATVTLPLASSFGAGKQIRLQATVPGSATNTITAPDLYYCARFPTPRRSQCDSFQQHDVSH
jgi:hypothetical protein